MVLYYVFTAYALRAFLLPSRLLKHPLTFRMYRLDFVTYRKLELRK